MNTEQQKWDRIYTDKRPGLPQAAEVLIQNRHLLPAKGMALDLACGLGGNSLLLAQSGLDVLSWDVSPVAIAKLQQLAGEQALKIRTEVRDVIRFPPDKQSVDVLLVSHFLVRDMAADLAAALKPGGLLFYQTFCQNKVSEVGPKNPDYLLADNELLRLFAGLKIRVYREESLLGQRDSGWRNQAMLVAEKSLA